MPVCVLSESQGILRARVLIELLRLYNYINSALISKSHFESWYIVCNILVKAVQSTAWLGK